MRQRFLAVAIMAIFATSESHGQDNFTPAINNVFDFAGQSATMNDVNRMNNELMERSIGQSSSNAPQQQTQLASVVYRASPARTRANLEKFVEKTRASSPAGAAQMSALFASTDIIAEMDRLMQQTYGMRANNVADAYAMWWTSAWNGAQGRNDDPSAGQMAMVKRQAANALAATPEFAAANDAGKQELAEALLVQAAMIQGAIDEYKSNPAMLAKARAAIRQGAKGMGLDLNTMTLTDEGFVPARKTGAVAGKGDTRLADADTGNAPVTNDNSPPGFSSSAKQWDGEVSPLT
jgi:hypothetical protein